MASISSRESVISANVADILIKKLRDQRAQARELRIPPPTPTRDPPVRQSPELAGEASTPPDGDSFDAVKRKLGIIDTCFPSYKPPPVVAPSTEVGQSTAGQPEEPVVEEEYPETYRTLSSKEKLVLLFAENFRRQYREKFAHRKALVLALPNECGVQKFVCTTLRPSVLLFPDLIGSWEAIAAFVADYIIYEPLDNQVNMPSRLISPDAVLRRRRANSFELATLLCSFLIGNGFAACVVSGYATREVANNDQRRVACPFVPVDEEESGEEEKPESPNKYQLRQPPDLRSQYLLNIEEEKVAKVHAEETNREAAAREERERQEQPPHDPKRGHRVHAWVAVLHNAPWCYKPGYREPAIDPLTGEHNLPAPSAFFLEPSTGFRHEASSPDYLAIESVWNQHNYYVNKQDPAAGIAAMRWDLACGADWEHFLPGEPYELREDCVVPEDQDPLTTDEEIEKEKHLDLPVSWVRPLNVSRTDFERRFPEDGAKVVYFKRTIYERFAPYRNLIGLVRRLTTYETLDYQQPVTRWEWYANRDDLLHQVRIDYGANATEERFDKGRTDCLRSLRHRAAPNDEYELKFFHQYRFDALRTLIYHASYIQEHYDRRDDLLHYREFRNIPKDPVTKEPSKLTHILEKFHQNPAKVPVKDIAVRNCFIQENKITLQFHYGEDCITASTREFIKPPKSEMGEEVPYDPNCTTGYVSNPWDPQPTQLDLFLLLKEQLKAEEQSTRAFCRRVVEIDTMLSERRKQTDSPRLTTSLYDPLRNEQARQMRLAKYEAAKAREEQLKQQQADFLAPYFLRLGDTKKRPPTRAQVMRLYRDCTADLRKFYQRLEEELRNRCDGLITEEQSLKRFLSRFQQHFEDAEYERFIAEGETLERDKHILQMRLENIQDEYRRKADHLKQALREDERLKPFFTAELELEAGELRSESAIE